jgi:hypothetical protein
VRDGTQCEWEGRGCAPLCGACRAGCARSGGGEGRTYSIWPVRTWLHLLSLLIYIPATTKLII